MRRALVCLSVLAACGRSGDDGGARRERGQAPGRAATAGSGAGTATNAAGTTALAAGATKPAVAAGRTAPATSVAVPAEAHASRALACVLELAGSRGARADVLDDVVDEAPRGGLAAIVRAVKIRGALGDVRPLVIEAQAAVALADRGRADEARALLEGEELAALDDRVSVDIGVELGEVRLRAGLRVPIGRDRALIRIRAQALGGDVAGAAKAFASVDTSRLGTYDVVPHLTALQALGREDEAYAVLATADPSLRWAAHGKLAAVALARAAGVERASDARFDVDRPGRAVDDTPRRTVA